MIAAAVDSAVLGLALQIAMICIILAFLAGAWRLLRGPTLADRVVALDFLSMLMTVFLVLFALVSGVAAYFYVAVALALVSFLGTVAFARYIERAQEDADD